MVVKLVIFDIDGTILQTYSWQFLHQRLNTWETAQGYNQQFFNHQITYQQWARLDAGLWKNQPITTVRQIIDRMPYTKGAKATLSALQQAGIKTYLLSAGLTQVAQRIQQEAGADGYRANTLIVEDGALTGEVEVNVAFRSKDKQLPFILQEFDLTREECAAVGDDPTLVPLFRQVGLAIAFNPADKTVEKHADIVVRSKDLRDVLPHILGKQQQDRDLGL